MPSTPKITGSLLFRFWLASYRWLSTFLHVVGFRVTIPTFVLYADISLPELDLERGKTGRNVLISGLLIENHLKLDGLRELTVSALETIGKDVKEKVATTTPL